MSGPDGLEERTAEAEELSQREWDRIEQAEQRGDDLRDELIGIIRAQRL